MGQLDGTVAVITGASRGLGEAMARGFAAEGASLVLAARTAADLDRVARACVDAGATQPTVVSTDIGNEAQLRALVDQALATFGRLDVFVANAGVAVPNLTDERPKTLADYPYDVASELMRVNCMGMWLSMKMALPAMGEGGSFIAVGSELGRMASAGSGMYAVSKASVDVLVKIAAAEAEPHGIRVNELSPGGMVDTYLFGPNKMPDYIKKHAPYSEPDVIVPAATWLASDESIGVTGAFVVANEFNKRPISETRQQLLADTGAADDVPG